MLESRKRHIGHHLENATEPPAELPPCCLSFWGAPPPFWSSPLPPSSPPEPRGLAKLKGLLPPLPNPSRPPDLPLPVEALTLFFLSDDESVASGEPAPATAPAPDVE